MSLLEICMSKQAQLESKAIEHNGLQRGVYLCAVRRVK